MAAGAIVDRWYRTTEDGRRVKTDRHGQGLRYRARYRLSPTREVSKSFARVRDADDWLAQQRVDAGRGVRVDPARAKISVRDWAERWLATKVDLKPSTAARYRSILDTHVLPVFGSHRLEDVQHAQVQRWVAALSDSLAPASVRKAHRVLSMLLDLAVKDDRLAKNPATGCALPRVVHAERRYLTHQQVWRLADLASRGASGKRSRKDERSDRSDARLVVLVLAYCGLRWGELAALRVNRVDTMRRRITVAESVTEVDGRGLVWGTPKTHERRSVPMPRFVADLLAEHIAGREQDALVFTGQRSGGCCAGICSGVVVSTVPPMTSVYRGRCRTSCDIRPPRWRLRPGPTSSMCSGCWDMPQRR